MANTKKIYLLPKAYNVTEFTENWRKLADEKEVKEIHSLNDDAKFVAILSYRDSLRALSTFSDE